jgi:hypothetical protein
VRVLTGFSAQVYWACALLGHSRRVGVRPLEEAM